MKIKWCVVICIFQVLLGPSLWAINWTELSVDQKASYLEELYYYGDGGSVEGVRPISIKTEKLLLNSPYRGKYSSYINKLFSTFKKEVDREAIEQYDGELLAIGPRVTTLILIIDSYQKVLASVISTQQEGLDPEGNSGDISWSAWLRADQNAHVLRNRSGRAYDDLYYEWSGY